VKAKKELGEEITTSGLYGLARELRRQASPQKYRRDNSQKNVKIPSRITPPTCNDLIEELGNHRNLLANVLQPMHTGEEKTCRSNRANVALWYGY